MPMTPNCVFDVNAAGTRSPIVRYAGHLATAAHLESNITGEWPWPNGPSVGKTHCGQLRDH